MTCHCVVRDAFIEVTHDSHDFICSYLSQNARVLSSVGVVEESWLPFQLILWTARYMSPTCSPNGAESVQQQTFVKIKFYYKWKL
jgi:hypothetical protein